MLISQKIKKKGNGSLLVCSNEKSRKNCLITYKKMPSLVLQKASLTVEAALVLPLLIFAMVTLAGVMDFLRMENMIIGSMQESAETLGMYGAVEELSMGAVLLKAESNIPTEVRKKGSLSFIGSNVSAEKVELKASYSYRLPFVLFPLQKENRVRVYCWLGNNYMEQAAKSSAPEEMVYVTDHESVYHESAVCSHLQLSVRAVPVWMLGALRNGYHKRYQECEFCKNKGTSEAGSLYITDFGDCFHISARCPGLKRTVRLVKKSSVPGLPGCSRCARGG